MGLPARSPVARAGIKAGFKTSYQRAQAVGCSRVYLLKAEEGAIRPSPALVAKMAAAYGISEDALWRRFQEVRRDRLHRELKAI